MTIKDQHDELAEKLHSQAAEPLARDFLELLRLRRELHRDKLEKSEDVISRGRALECKDLLNLLDM